MEIHQLTYRPSTRQFTPNFVSHPWFGFPELASILRFILLTRQFTPNSVSHPWFGLPELTSILRGRVLEKHRAKTKSHLAAFHWHAQRGGNTLFIVSKRKDEHDEGGRSSMFEWNRQRESTLSERKIMNAPRRKDEHDEGGRSSVFEWNRQRESTLLASERKIMNAPRTKGVLLSSSYPCKSSK